MVEITRAWRTVSSTSASRYWRPRRSADHRRRPDVGAASPRTGTVAPSRGAEQRLVFAFLVKRPVPRSTAGTDEHEPRARGTAGVQRPAHRTVPHKLRTGEHLVVSMRSARLRRRHQRTWPHLGITPNGEKTSCRRRRADLARSMDAPPRGLEFTRRRSPTPWRRWRQRRGAEQKRRGSSIVPTPLSCAPIMTRSTVRDESSGSAEVRDAGRRGRVVTRSRRRTPDARVLRRRRRRDSPERIERVFQFRRGRAPRDTAGTGPGPRSRAINKLHGGRSGRRTATRAAGASASSFPACRCARVPRPSRRGGRRPEVASTAASTATSRAAASVDRRHASAARRAKGLGRVAAAAGRASSHSLTPSRAPRPIDRLTTPCQEGG